MKNFFSEEHFDKTYKMRMLIIVSSTIYLFSFKNLKSMRYLKKRRKINAIELNSFIQSFIHKMLVKATFSSHTHFEAKKVAWVEILFFLRPEKYFSASHFILL